MHVLWEMYEYVSASKKVPFSIWFSDLNDSRAKGLILQRLRRITIGNFGDCRFLRDGVFELRIHWGSGYRVYFGRSKNKVVLLLCGGDKGSQARDISRAIEYWNDFKRRDHEALSRFSS